MLESIDRKNEQAAKMFDELVSHINDELTVKNIYSKRRIGVPQWLKN